MTCTKLSWIRAMTQLAVAAMQLIADTRSVPEDIQIGSSTTRWLHRPRAAFARNLTDESGIVAVEPERANGTNCVYEINVVQPRTYALSALRTFRSISGVRPRGPGGAL